MLRTTQFDHSLCQVCDTNRLAHVEDIDLTPITHGTRLQHQLTSLRNQHKVTDNVRMRYGDRTTVPDLLAENRDDRTVATQYITKTGSHKLRYPLHFPCLDSLIQTLHIDFTDTLATSHHIGRVHRLVRTYHHKLLGTILHRQVRHDTRTINIVLHRLTRIILHHRHMLVGRCMEHIFRTELLVYLLHTRCITNAGHDGMRLDTRMMFAHIQTHIMHRCLRLVYQNQLCRIIDSYLTHHLATDTARCPCDQDTLTGKHAAHLIHIDFDFVTRKQVLNFHLLQHHVVQVTLAIPLISMRHHVDVDILFDQTVQQLRVITEHLVIDRRHQQHGSPT